MIGLAPPGRCIGRSLLAEPLQDRGPELVAVDRLRQVRLKPAARHARSSCRSGPGRWPAPSVPGVRRSTPAFLDRLLPICKILRANHRLRFPIWQSRNGHLREIPELDHRRT